MRNDSSSDPTPILTTIGDLDSPLWGDERDRIIHLEGAAVAQQLQMFIGLAVGAAMPWVLGRAGIWFGLATIAATSIGNLCYGRYISARGVKCHSIFAAGERKRGALLIAIVSVFGLGALSTSSSRFTVDTGMLLDGLFIAGAVVVGLGVGIALSKALRKRNRNDVPDDVFTNA